MVKDMPGPSNPMNDPLLRREAGEGWLPEGTNKILLGAIVAREAIADELRRYTEGEISAEQGEDLLIEYADQVDHVRKIKNEFGIDDPPPIQI